MSTGEFLVFTAVFACTYGVGFWRGMSKGYALARDTGVAR